MTKAAELAKMGDVITNGQLSGRRNMVYNGNFQCWQRSTSETGLGTASGYFTADRWRVNLGGTSAGRFTMNRTAGDPDGFNYGLVINCTTIDTTIAADEQLRINQRFEGQDLQHLKKGTSGAETTTISFYAKVVGSATNFVVELQDNDNSRSISKMFTFTTDWVRYYWTIPGDTTGSLDQDTSMSMTINFWLHSGSNHTSGTLNTDWNSRTNANVAAGIHSIFSSTSNEFYLAGVQWEVSSQATPFEHRSLGEELFLCQRYYYQFQAATNFMKIGHGRAYDTSNTTCTYTVPVPMRASPTGGISSASHVGVAGLSAGGTTGFTTNSERMDDLVRFAANVTRSGADMSAGTIYQIEADNNTNMKLTLDAEL
jgi:hypothetical protein|tara:strand:+ start:862 stop:1971 length:1110 start_codon:yes stop_codon:yes gene_type:complete